MKTCVRGHEIKRGEAFYQQVTAWVANEKRDSVTLRKDVSPPRYACRFHVKQWQSGVGDDQGTLL